MAITFLRHAPVDKKYQKKYLGHTNICIDKNQIDLKKIEKLKSQKYDLIYCSDLIRCTQTLDLLGLKYLTDKRLREVKFKDNIELKSFTEIEKFDDFKMEYLESLETWHNYVCKETIEEFNDRINSFISILPKNKNILICSHLGTIRMFYKILENKNLEKLNYLESICIR